MKQKTAIIGFGILFSTVAMGTTVEVTDFGEAVDLLAGGAEEVRVELTGEVERKLDEDDYLFVVDGERILLDTWESGLGILEVGSTVTVSGELERSDEDEYGVDVEYELDAYDGDDTGSGQDDDTRGELPVLGFVEALERLEMGAEEVRVELTGEVERKLDEDDYLFVVDGERILLDTWNSGLGNLEVGSTVTVTGELEWTDEDEYGVEVKYELDVLSGSDEGSGEAGGGSGGESGGDGDDVGQLWTNLTEAVAYLEANPGVEEVAVRVTGTVGARIGDDADDEDYRFEDESGQEVVVDLDRRVSAEFALETGLAITLYGELERDSEFRELGLEYEVDVWEVSFANGEVLDLGERMDLAGRIISDWLGTLRPMEEGWAEHSSLGTVYPVPQEDGLMVLFVEGLDSWLVTSPALYPLAYETELGWLWLAGSAYGEVQHAYQFRDADSGEGKWHLNLGQ